MKRLSDFNAFTADFPKERFGNGVNWEQAQLVARCDKLVEQTGAEAAPPR